MYSDDIRRWRQAAMDPKQLGGDMPVGAIIAGTLRRKDANKAQAYAGYAAPFPAYASKAGARRFPVRIPFAEPVLGQSDEQTRDFAILPTLPMPKHVIFGDADGIFQADW